MTAAVQSAGLEMRGVAKRFGSTVALAGVDLTVAPGEVHALLGENGAGKSTLMRVLAGACTPDAGSMTLWGEPYAPRGPLEGLRAGVAMVYQELNLAPELTVAQNIMLGRERTRGGFECRAEMAASVREVLGQVGAGDLPLDRRVRDLGPGARQLVEVARGLAHRARVVVMDEPTSSLAAQDVQRLFAAVRRLRDRGIGIVYISHFLEEVWEIADRFTVLRDGRTVGSGDVAGTTHDRIVEMMAGREIGEVFPTRGARTVGAPVLRLDGLAGQTLPGPTDLQLCRGEIVGLAGLCGAGRTELLRAVFGLAPVRAGAITVAAVTDHGAGPPTRLGQGVGLLSEDRVLEGLALNRSLAENLTLSRMDGFTRWGWISPGRRNAIAQQWIDRLRIRTRGPSQAVSGLSGGNQQKVALARLLHHDVDVLLLDEPTRGIDVGSRAEIYGIIEELATRGAAILMVSSYNPELMGLCDRIAVMHRGSLGAARPVAEWTEERLLAAATGGDTHG